MKQVENLLPPFHIRQPFIAHLCPMPAPIPILSYGSFVHYWTALAHQHCALNGSIYVGDSWRIIGTQRTNIIYPAMWLERPVIETNFDADGDSPMAVLKCALSIVGGVQTDDWEGQQARLDECRNICGQVIARLKRDADFNYFDLVFPVIAEPLATILADDLYGWCIEFEIEMRQWTECFEEEVWGGLDYAGTDYTGIGFWKLEDYLIQ